jgi:phage baseplate assembly protein W
LSCVTDLTSDCAEVSGVMCWLQSLARRLQTPLGGLLDDPDYGYGILDELDGETNPSDLDAIASKVDSEFLKDERTLASNTNVVTTDNNGAVSITITSRVVSALGPFRLVLSVSQVTVQILSVSPG